MASSVPLRSTIPRASADPETSASIWAWSLGGIRRARSTMSAAERNFERNFQLADHVQIKGASLENGLLQVDLLRVVPEAMKPRAIPITTAKKVVLEGKASAKIAA